LHLIRVQQSLRNQNHIPSRSYRDLRRLRGKTSAEITQILGLTKHTVDFHTDNARGKLGAATSTAAAIKAASGRFIEP
jgi:DNA-binding NarL/FixJ family response regulator